MRKLIITPTTMTKNNYGKVDNNTYYNDKKYSHVKTASNSFNDKNLIYLRKTRKQLLQSANSHSLLKKPTNLARHNF